MKKRLFIGLVVGAMCVGLAGCGGNNSGSNSNIGGSESISTEVGSESKIDTEIEEASSEENAEKKGLPAVDTPVLTEKLPDMVSAFPDREIKGMVIEDSYVRYGVDDVESDEFDAYVKSCQDAGYVLKADQGSSDTGGSYFAYTEDGQYYITIIYSISYKHVTICLTDESKQ